MKTDAGVATPQLQPQSPPQSKLQPLATATPILWQPSSKSLDGLQVQMVVACGQDRAIGERGTMPWRLSADLKHFKQITSHTCVIMGRKTLESIGRALPQRRNIVLSSDPLLTQRYAQIEVVASLEQALALATQPQQPQQSQPPQQPQCHADADAGADATATVQNYNTISLIGGASVFAAGMKLASRLVITEIAATFPHADTFFPEIDLKRWYLVATQPEAPEAKTETQAPCYYFCADPQPDGFAQQTVAGLKLVDETGATLNSDALASGLAYRYLVYQAR